MQRREQICQKSILSSFIDFEKEKRLVIADGSKETFTSNVSNTKDSDPHTDLILPRDRSESYISNHDRIRKLAA